MAENIDSLSPNARELLQTRVNPVNPPKPKSNLPLLITLLVVVVILVLGILVYRTFFADSFSRENPNNSSQNAESDNPSSSQTTLACGGIAGIVCPQGYTCLMKANHPDASGVCVKE